MVHQTGTAGTWIAHLKEWVVFEATRVDGELEVE